VSPRVYLFALMPGGKRPVVVAWCGRCIPGTPILMDSENLRAWKDARFVAGPWWLVECESAEAGRACITAFQRASFEDWDDRRGVVETVALPKATAPQNIYRGAEKIGRIIDSGEAR
jgi:hypothetical protein